jgi:hypothetical protein
MLAMAFIEIAAGAFALGWFGHMFHVWHKRHHWEGSRLQQFYLRWIKR